MLGSSLDNTMEYNDALFLWLLWSIKLMIEHLLKLKPDGLQLNLEEYLRRFGSLDHTKELRPC